MLKDLSKIITEQKMKVSAFKNQKVLLTAEFRERYLNSMKDNSRIEFYDTFAVVTSTKKLRIYIPNQWFYLAFIGAPLAKEVKKYRIFIRSKLDLSKKEFENFIKNAKNNDLDEEVFGKIVQGLSDEEKEFIKKFLVEYSWWGGAKDLSRDDYYISPVLGLLELVQVSSSYVADIANLLASNFEISDTQIDRFFILNEENLKNKNYEELFREWIVRTVEANKSNVKYIGTLNRFVKDVNNELTMEEFTPIDVWNNPKNFANQYSVESIMSIADKLKSNTAYITTGKSGSELKTIYNKYLKWADTLPQEWPDTINEVEDLEYSSQQIKKSRQYIYFGAPGTGKSYKLNEDSREFGNNVERVTFYPNMSYGNFVGVFKPFPVKIGSDESRITYKYVPGPLIKQLIEALLHPDRPYLLIIEELNRANVSAVFGDLFQLLDRNQEYVSEYPIAISEDLKEYCNQVYENCTDEDSVTNMRETMKNGLVFPSNFYIWATMNSADQGVVPMDTAFKRRWDQKYFGLDDAWEENKEDFTHYKKIKYQVELNGEVSDRKVSWNVLRRIINDMLSMNMNIPEDKLLGPYFISKNILIESDEAVTEAFKSKVLMYLFDDVAKQNRSLVFKKIEKMRYSEIVKTFETIGIEIFGINDQEIEKYNKEE